MNEKQVHAMGNTAVGLTVLASLALAQTVPVAVRPPLLFQESWRLLPHQGAPSDDNQRIGPLVVGNPQLELHTYGPTASSIIAAEHEGRVDLWTGLATSPVAVTLRYKSHHMDLRGLARLRGILRTNAIQTLYPILKLADGTLVIAKHPIVTDGQFLQVEVAFGGLQWYTLDPEKVVVRTEYKSPDLSRVDEVGFATLSPSAGHGLVASANISTLELYAAPVKR
jgi:hypothetical protein